MNQIQLIKKVKKYLDFISKKKINIYKSAFSYLVSWEKNPGYVKMKFIQGEKNKIIYYLLLFKFFLSTAFFAKKVLIHPKKKITSSKIIISWCIKKDFSLDGKYYDRYFGLSNNDLKDFFWILISLDNYLPKKYSKNLSIITLESSNILKNFFIFIKRLLNLIKKENFSIIRIAHYIFNTTWQSEQITNTIKSTLNLDSVKTMLLPYEGQPFQKIIISKVKKENPKSKVIGYLHSCLPSLPVEYIYNKSYSPDLVFYHGNSYKKILNKFLYWPKTSIKLIKSLRYAYDTSKNFKANIYLPYEIYNKKLLLNEFENFVRKNSQYNLSKLKAVIHPIKKKVIEHINFSNQINNICKKNKKHNHNKYKSIPIFFNQTNFFEGLEIYYEVIHISSDPLFETLWPNVKITKLSNYVFKYKLLKSGEYINFGNNNNKKNFINYIKNKN